MHFWGAYETANSTVSAGSNRMAGCSTATMLDSDVAAAIGSHVRAFNDRDIDALMSGFTDDACWISGSTVVRGRAERA